MDCYRLRIVHESIGSLPYTAWMVLGMFCSVKASCTFADVSNAIALIAQLDMLTFSETVILHYSVSHNLTRITMCFTCLQLILHLINIPARNGKAIEAYYPIDCFCIV
jgi:hypothetical protein